MVTTTQSIIKSIKADFTASYKNAANFPSTKLYNDSITIISDLSNIKCIVFANDLGIPPVKSMLVLLNQNELLQNNVTALESQCLGSLMGFIFKNVLCYRAQKERNVVNMFGVKTATRFYEVEKLIIEN